MHTLAVLLLELQFFAEYPDCVNDTANIFQFPDLCLSTGFESSMVSRRWDTALDSNTATSYADAAALMKQHRIPPIVGWEAAAKMLEQWLVVVTVLLGPQDRHPAVFELATILAVVKEVKSRLRAQVAVQQDTPAALVRLIQTEFDESFRQVFTSHLPVLWTHFTPLIRTLATGHFHPGTVTIPWGFWHSLPTTITAHRTAAPPHKTLTTVQRVGEAYTAT